MNNESSTCRRVFILGAGFSKPAGMPLATELTEGLVKKVSERDGLEDMQAWINGFQEKLQWFNQNQTNPINIEELFHYAKFEEEIWRMQQHLCRVGRYDGETAWGKANDIMAWLSYLEEDLVELLWEKQKQADLDPIKQFAEHLRSGDVILTFNYDTLLERALGELKKPWSHGLEDTKSDAVVVLKLHGSLDWIILPRDNGNQSICTKLFSKSDDNAPADNKEHEYHNELWRVNGSTDLDRSIKYRSINNRYFGLAGLGSYKPLHHIPGSGLVWARADGALAETSEVYVVGFSLSPFDALARLYFGAAIQRCFQEKNSLPKTTVIDPRANELLPRFKEVFGNNICIKQMEAEKVDWGCLG